jgi:hypothetical protein
MSNIQRNEYKWFIEKTDILSDNHTMLSDIMIFHYNREIWQGYLVPEK